MKALKEAISRRANVEDRCSGACWEGRYKSVPLLDQAALVACMAYVDLNPIRAKVGLCPQPKGCHRRAPAHLSAYSSGDCVPRTPCPLAVYIIDSNFILENIDDANGQGTKVTKGGFRASRGAEAAAPL